MKPILRFLGAADIASGLVALMAAGWLGDQLDVGTTAVRLTGVALIALGGETLALAGRRFMGVTNAVVEAGVALLAVDLVVLRDPTATGTAILLATAVYCAAATVRLVTFLRTRTGRLVAA